MLPSPARISERAPRTSGLDWTRTVLAAGLFIAEAQAFHDLLQAKVGASFLLQWSLMSLAVFLCCGVMKYRQALVDFLRQPAATPIRGKLLAAHFGSLAALAGVTGLIVSAGAGQAWLRPLLVALWYAAFLAAAVCGVLAFFEWTAVREMLRRTGLLWLYAGGVGAAGLLVRMAIDGNGVDDLFWGIGINPTFALVCGLLRLFVSNVAADPAAHRIGTERFHVVIATTCSGLEGMSMTLLFGVALLWFFRRELRFPRSILLVPGSVVLIYLLNTLRLTALILIGHAGAPEVALGGFHTHSGWIFLSCVAIGMTYAVHSPLLRQPAEPEQAIEAAGDNPTAAYLLPLLTIIAMSMLTRAMSAGFDWLYPLRVLVAAAVLWWYRDRYARVLHWTPTAAGPLVGAAAFLLWIALDAMTGRGGAPAPGASLGAALGALPPIERVPWLIFRVLGATLTVPLAEELAFRGFALRRLQSADFEAVASANNGRSWTWLALAVSSLGFGLMHGDRWIAGSVAGAMYAYAMLRRGQLADAIIAHATTNALLAAWVLTTGAWGLW